jgi:hypothetical protein
MTDTRNTLPQAADSIRILQRKRRVPADYKSQSNPEPRKHVEISD